MSAQRHAFSPILVIVSYHIVSHHAGCSLSFFIKSLSLHSSGSSGSCTVLLLYRGMMSVPSVLWSFDAYNTQYMWSLTQAYMLCRFYNLDRRRSLSGVSTAWPSLDRYTHSAHAFQCQTINGSHRVAVHCIPCHTLSQMRDDAPSLFADCCHLYLRVLGDMNQTGAAPPAADAPGMAARADTSATSTPTDALSVAVSLATASSALYKELLELIGQLGTVINYVNSPRVADNASTMLTSYDLHVHC